MDKLKVGDIGYVKITGEPAFILHVDTPPVGENWASELGEHVVVRLTGASQNNPPQYPMRDLRMAELESLADRAQRDFQETQRLENIAKSLSGQLMPKTKEAKSELPN